MKENPKKDNLFSPRCIISGVQGGVGGGGSGGRKKADLLLFTHFLKHGRSSERQRVVSTAGPTHTGKCSQNLSQHACLIHLYFWKHPLCKQFAFKISARLFIQKQARWTDADRSRVCIIYRKWLMSQLFSSGLGMICQWSFEYLKDVGGAWALQMKQRAQYWRNACYTRVSLPPPPQTPPLNQCG